MVSFSVKLRKEICARKKAAVKVKTPLKWSISFFTLVFARKNEKMGGLESDNIVVGYDSSVNISALGSHHINTLAWLRIVSFVVWDEKRGKPLELFNSIGSYSMFPWL